MRVGTWNVLLEEDEFSEAWGCPLSIAFCGSESDLRLDAAEQQKVCASRRYQRIWEALEKHASRLDILCLQEASHDFLSIQNEESKWQILHQSGECVILQSTAVEQAQQHTRYKVTSQHEVVLPHLSGCPTVPMVILQSEQDKKVSVAVGSVHVSASESIDRAEWYTRAIQTMDTQLPDKFRSPIILGGDFNHNLTDVSLLDLESEANNDGWDLVYPHPNQTLLQGTSQKEFNWMGTFDGFLIRRQHAAKRFRKKDPHTVVSTFLNGFMPKVVQGFPQHQANQIQEEAQFRFQKNDHHGGAHLYFSPSSRYPDSPDGGLGRNDRIVMVPNANPETEALSDHLWVALVMDVGDGDTSTDPFTFSMEHDGAGGGARGVVTTDSDRTTKNLVEGGLLSNASNAWMLLVPIAVVIVMVVRQRIARANAKRDSIALIRLNMMDGGDYHEDGPSVARGWVELT